MRSHRHILAIATTLLAAACTVAATAPAATSSTVVGATVPSATSLDAAGCPPRTTDVTNFGTVLPGGSFVTANPCTVTFGSSNDTASLRVMQADRRGAGMHRSFEPETDTSFGSGGIAHVDVDPVNDDEVGASWSDPSTGNIYVTGTTGTTPNRDIYLVRFLADGTPDGTFGPGGVRTYDLGGDELGRSIVAIGDIGEVALVGTKDGDALIYRLDLAGDPVTGWANSGVRTIDLAPENVTAAEMYEAPQGGYFISIGDESYTTILRYDESLEPMNGWGAAGTLTIPGYACNALAPKADGSLLCSGAQVIAPGNERALVGRITANGSLDTTFSADGLVEFDPGDPGLEDQVFKVVEANGYIYASGIMPTAGGAEAMIARLLLNGTLDPAFGSGGIFTYVLPGQVANAGGHLTVLDQQGTLEVGGLSMDPVTGFGVHVGHLSPQLTWMPGAVGSSTGYRIIDLDAPGLDVAALRGGGVSFDGDFVLPMMVDSGGANLATGVTRLDAGAPLPDYATGVNDWDDGTSFFGVCAAQVVGAVAVADWTTGACTAADGAHWRALPTGGAPAIAAHTTGPTAVDAQLDLHFGLRLAANTAPGDYEAPIRFEVVAPDA